MSTRTKRFEGNGICPRCGFVIDDHTGWDKWPELKCPKETANA